MFITIKKHKKIRVVLAVNKKRENYYGLSPAVAFLDYTMLLENNLKEYLNDDTKKAFYTTEEDITTNKTKVNNIIIK